jgi:hypothetical protein
MCSPDYLKFCTEYYQNCFFLKFSRDKRAAEGAE